jgi:hypothetical protein
MLKKRAGDEAEANKAQQALSTSGVLVEEVCSLPKCHHIYSFELPFCVCLLFCRGPAVRALDASSCDQAASENDTGTLATSSHDGPPTVPTNNTWGAIEIIHGVILI